MKIRKYEDFKRVLIIHGFGVTNTGCFYPWLKSELEKLGYNVELPNLPNTEDPLADEQVEYLLDNYPSKKDIIVCHSYGGVTAMKFIESINYNIKSIYMISCFCDNDFHEGDEDIEKLEYTTNWKFDYDDIMKKCENIYVLKPSIETLITEEQLETLADNLNTEVITFEGKEDHATGKIEPGILNFIKKHES